MNPLLQILNRISPTLLFIFLMLIAVLLIVRNNEAQGRIFWNSTGIVTSALSNGANSIWIYFNLNRENEKLRQEISDLRSQMGKNDYDNRVNVDTAQKILDTNRIQIYSYIPATVVGNSVDKPKNYIMLNRGSYHKVRPNMGVITSDGVLGVVRYVSTHYCIVMSILHTDTRVSAQIKSKEFYGSLRWDGDDPRYMYLMDIPKHNKIQTGEDIVETTGFSTYYPPGIEIGRVFYHEVPPGSSNHLIKVKLNTNMSKVRYAQIVVNRHAEEIHQLEALIKDEQ